MKPNPNRDAAITLLREMAATNSIGGAGPLYGISHDSIHESLRKRADEAAQDLAAFKRVHAMATAVVALLPGVICVDASEHLPREKWDAFASNDPDEWREWLAGEGLAGDVIEDLLLNTVDSNGNRAAERQQAQDGDA